LDVTHVSLATNITTINKIILLSCKFYVAMTQSITISVLAMEIH